MSAVLQVCFKILACLSILARNSKLTPGFSRATDQQVQVRQSVPPFSFHAATIILYSLLTPLFASQPKSQKPTRLSPPLVERSPYSVPCEIQRPWLLPIVRLLDLPTLV